MTVLGFLITFHTEFRVGSSYARDGVDAAIDHDDPLPADHLKGIMRAVAEGILGRGHPMVTTVFGSPAAPSPWSWTSAQPTDSERWRFSRRFRVKIDERTGTATKDQLVLGEQAWAPQARFEVHSVGGIAMNEAAHVRLLRIAGAGVHGLGAWRRRGLGWVGVVPDSGPVTADEINQVLSWQTGEQ